MMTRKLLLLGLSLSVLAACGRAESPAQTTGEGTPVAAPEAAASSQPRVKPGELKFATLCAGCHGRLAQGMGAFPKLAGKPAAELAGKLRRYRAGEQVGPQSATMRPFAMPLADEDIEQITDYIADL